MGDKHLPRYVREVTSAYLAAPPYSEEEEALERVLNLACERHQLDAEEVTRALIAEGDTYDDSAQGEGE